MPAEKIAPNWQVATQSVRGASHEQTRAPNQDAVGALRLQGQRGVILAVADGHGDDKHARSDRGSRFAVQAGIETLGEWTASDGLLAEHALRRSATSLPEKIVRAWRAKVADDVKADPISEAVDLDGEGPEILYGSTLIVACVGERFDLFLQIGDGDILVVATDGAVNRRARGRTDLPSHLTESMCQADAVDRFRVELVFRGRETPRALVMLSSDGYANSFVDESSFLKVGADLKSILERHGIDHVVSKLAQWLTETSQEGSGDDISLALAWDRAAVPHHARRKRPQLTRAAVPIVLLAVLVPLATWAYFPSTWSRLNPAQWPELVSELVEKVQKVAGRREGRVDPGAQKGGAALPPAPADLPPLP